MVLTTVMVPSVQAYDQPQATWTQKNSGYGGPGWHAYKSATVGYFGAVWIPGRNVYEYNFRIEGNGETRWSDGSAADACRIQRVEIKETTNKGHHAMWTSTDPRYIGVWPHAGSTTNYFDVAFAITSLAVGAINEFAGFALGVADLLISMVSAVDHQQNGEIVERSWYYSPDESDLAHWFWWLHDVDPNQQVKFTVTDELYGPGYEYVGTGWEFTCTTPSAPSRMTQAEKEKYGLEIIPVDQLQSRAKELQIAPEKVIELNAIGKPVYYFHKLPVSVSKIEPKPQEKLLNASVSIVEGKPVLTSL